MFEPALLALTSTPSIAASSAELTTPVSATAGGCASAARGNGTARAAARLAATRCGWRMVSPAGFQIELSIGSAAGKQQGCGPAPGFGVDLFRLGCLPGYDVPCIEREAQYDAAVRPVG